MSQDQALPPDAAARTCQHDGSGGSGVTRSAAPPSSVTSLGSASTGRFLVRSHNTAHVLDLDARIYERRPGASSQRFAHDGVPVRLTRVEIWPTVGGRMLIWFEDPDSPDLLEHWRLCSTIRSITTDPTPTPR